MPRADEPSPSQIERAAAVLAGAEQPDRAGRPRRRRGPGPRTPCVRFAETLGLPVATTFHGKGVFPDDHPHALGAVGFMRHDYVNFGFDEADVIIAVGYELQEFDPVRINPDGDKQIIHMHRFPAEVDSHYDVEVGIQADIGRTLDAAGRRRRPPLRAPATPSDADPRTCSPTSWHAAAPTTASPSRRSGSWPTPAPRWAATTSCSSTPAR